jgi:hypothetical protein
MDRFALFVRAQQQRDRAPMPGMRGDEGFQRADHRRDAALHVGRAATVQQAVAHDGFEGISLPALARARRTTSVCPRNTSTGRTARAVRGPQIAHVAEGKVFDREAGSLQALGNQQLAAGVVGRDGGTAYQLAGEIEDIGHALSRGVNEEE